MYAGRRRTSVSSYECAYFNLLSLKVSFIIQFSCFKVFINQKSSSKQTHQDWLTKSRSLALSGSIYPHLHPAAQSSSQIPSILSWPIRSVGLQNWAWCWSDWPEDSPLHRWYSSHWHCEGCSPRSKRKKHNLVQSWFQKEEGHTFRLFRVSSHLSKMRITQRTSGLWIYDYHTNTRQYLSIKKTSHAPL